MLVCWCVGVMSGYSDPRCSGGMGWWMEGVCGGGTDDDRQDKQGTEGWAWRAVELGEGLLLLTLPHKRRKPFFSLATRH